MKNPSQTLRDKVKSLGKEIKYGGKLQYFVYILCLHTLSLPGFAHRDKVKRQSRKTKYGVKPLTFSSPFFALFLLGVCLLGISASAAPLDDKITAYKQANTQTEAAVAELLELGLQEDRAAEALAVVKPWLAANPADSAELQFYAGRSMHFAGNWSDAVIFYRKMLRNKRIDAARAAVVVPAAYRLLINDMRDAGSAYLLMREDGNRLRQFGAAKQFDRWFMREAIRRSDVAALAARLAAIHENRDENPADYAEFMNKLYKLLETFAERDEDTVVALDNLALVATREPGFKARWDWINAVSRYIPEASELVHHRKPVPKELVVEPMKAAHTLLAADPLGGASLVVKGWSQWNHGDTPTFFRFAHAQRDIKAEPFVEALTRLSPADAKSLLNMGAKGPRGRWVSVASFISPANAQSVVPKFPTIFNAIDAPSMDLWHKDMTVDEAKELAPHIARNPHGSAALVRAYAVAGEKKMAGIMSAMEKVESWRFASLGKTSAARHMVDMVWNSGVDRSGVDHGNTVKEIETQFAIRHKELKKQIAKEANSKSRMAAFNQLYQELRGTPSTPAMLDLWDELLRQAPPPDKAQILQKLTADYVAAPPASKDLQTHLLRQGLGKIDFGNPYSKLSFGPGMAGGWDRWGNNNVRKGAPELASYLEALLQKQMRAGTLSEPVFSMWLHCVNPKKKESAAFIKELLKSPAYIKMNVAYHKLASHNSMLGSMALTAKSTDPHVVSRELLALPKAAAPAQVTAAFKAVITRVRQAPEAVAVIGLHKVAALPELQSETRKSVLALFDGLSPLGAYPKGQGYTALASRLVKEMQESEQWGAAIPCAPALWRAVETDANEGRNYPEVEKMVAFAEAALAAEAPSVAILFARAGIRGGYRSLDPNRTDRGCSQRFARLRAVAGKAAVAMGVVEIPVDETDSTYGIYKSNAEFVQGNVDSAWKLYLANAEHLFPTDRDPDARPLIRKLAVEYGFWLLQRCTEESRMKEAETIVKELTIWSRQESGVLSLEQDGMLKISYADLALRKGALPTSRAWYRKVADAQEYQGSDVYVRAALGSVNVDRVSRNFGSALEELEKLMRINNPETRARVRYARAEVMMDQENYKDAFDELEAVLRSDPNHADALILRGKIQFQMRKLVEATEIELGVSREEEVMVPGETLKINLHDPTLSISGVGADIEVEVFAKSGDSERVLLHQLGDNKEKFRADVVTALAPPVKGDKVLQVLGVDEI
ncbi:MAG: tetratricopeptide (TPR) repeat protein, partial [Rhodothermales bacterium]